MDTPEKIKVKYYMNYIKNERDDYLDFVGSIKIGDLKEFKWIHSLYDNIDDSSFAISKNLYADRQIFKGLEEEKRLYHPKWLFETLRAWLISIITGEPGYYYYFNRDSICDSTYLVYNKINNEIGTLLVIHFDGLDGIQELLPDEKTVSQLDLVKNFYIGFIDYIIDKFNYKDWFELYGGLKFIEPIYATFFSCVIDKYLKDNGVIDIDEKVKKAKNKIKEGRTKMYDEDDKRYERRDFFSIEEIYEELPIM